VAGSYRAKFKTNADAWREIYLPFAAFVPTSFGRLRRDLPALDSSKLRSFGFLISDRQAGPFALEVEWINVVACPEQHGFQRYGSYLDGHRRGFSARNVCLQ